MSDATQNECPKCGKPFVKKPETGAWCPECSANIPRSVPRSRYPLVVWIVWGFLPALLMFGSLLLGADQHGNGPLEPSNEFGFLVAIAGLFCGPVILYVWSASLLKSFDQKPIDAYVLAVPLGAVMYAINFGIAFAGCSIAGNFM